MITDLDRQVRDWAAQTHVPDFGPLAARSRSRHRRRVAAAASGAAVAVALVIGAVVVVPHHGGRPVTVTSRPTTPALVYTVGRPGEVLHRPPLGSGPGTVTVVGAPQRLTVTSAVVRHAHIWVVDITVARPGDLYERISSGHQEVVLTGSFAYPLGTVYGEPHTFFVAFPVNGEAAAVAAAKSWTLDVTINPG